MVDLRGQTVLVTGASSGIGRAAAEAFAARGSRVGLTVRSADGLDGLVRDIRGRGGEAVVISADVTDREAVSALSDRAVRAIGRIDVWIDNAGAGVSGPLLDAPLDLHRQTVAIDLPGANHRT